MFRYGKALSSTLSVLLLGSSIVVGCGDDDSGNAPGKGGSGGSAGSAGGSPLLPGGAGGAGGNGDSGGGGDIGAGATDAGSTSAGGSGGSGTLGSGVQRVTDTLVEDVNDLRGLTFSKSGKILASGFSGAGKSDDRKLAIVRFNADGSLDTDFGTDGIVSYNLVEREVTTTSVGGEGGAGGAPTETEVVVNDGFEESLGIVELASGELIVQANVRDSAGKGSDVVLVKLDADGELATDFGTDGVKRIDLGWSEADSASFPGTSGPNDTSWGIELDPSSDEDEQKLVVFAFGPAPKLPTDSTDTQRTDNDRYVVRVLASDGSIDPEFNDGKVFTLNTGGTFPDGARRGIVEDDGSILATGYTNYGDGLGNHIVLIRLKKNGKVDEDFGFGIGLPGVVRVNPFLSDGGIAECYSAARQSTGRYVTTGYGRATAAGTTSSLGWETTDAVDLVSVGLYPDGLDTSFGKSGTLAIQSEDFNLGNTEDRGRDVVALEDDRIVFVGRFGPNPAIFVTTPNGELDTSSGDEENGRFIYDALGDADTPTSHFFKVALSPDKKRIAATTSNHADGAVLAVLEVPE